MRLAFWDVARATPDLSTRRFVTVVAQSKVLATFLFLGGEVSDLRRSIAMEGSGTGIGATGGAGLVKRGTTVVVLAGNRRDVAGDRAKREVVWLFCFSTERANCRLSMEMALLAKAAKSWGSSERASMSWTESLRPSWYWEIFAESFQLVSAASSRNLWCNRNTVTSRDVHLQKTETCNIINLTSCLHSSLGLPIAW